MVFFFGALSSTDRAPVFGTGDRGSIPLERVRGVRPAIRRGAISDDMANPTGRASPYSLMVKQLPLKQLI